MGKLPQYQDIEDAYKAPKKVVNWLPESTETRRALEHLKIAEDYTMQARERARKDETACDD